jgi:hypothetical protein
MPRVVPSQIVALINEVFPDASHDPSFHTYSAHAPILAAIVRLTNELPTELVTISGKDYNDLVVGLESLTEAVDRWHARGGDEPPRRLGGKQPIVLVRDALVKCPDASPSPGTAGLPFITDAALRDSIRQDMSTAGSALHNGEWKGATVLAGAVAEALLLWAIQNRSTSSALVALPTAPSSPPENWMLGQLIEVAQQLRLIEQDTATQARLAKDFRNLIHPGRAQRTGVVCDRATALTALAAMELIVRDLS